MLINYLKEFLRLESAGGILLLGAAAVAMLSANSSLAPGYSAFLALPVELRAGDLQLAKPLLMWINDGLMAIFFFLVGLEIKREVLEGELSQPSQIALPAVAALGGMIVPAAIYTAFNWGDPVPLRGFAIPAATDIAFALGVLATLGSRVPASLKIFLLTLAILDDLGAIVIIALVYTSDLAPGSLLAATGAIVALTLLNRRGVLNLWPYLLAGIALWLAVLKSGVHATLAGVLLAFFIPLRASTESGDVEPPLKKAERDLHPVVAYAILPLFAFANAGVPLQGISLASLFEPVPLGVAAGLFLGKQAGVFGASWLAVRLGVARKPEDASWTALYGVAVLCGIGFTMSLFIGTLAFESASEEFLVTSRLGILTGSLLSAVAGYVLLRLVLPQMRADETGDTHGAAGAARAGADSRFDADTLPAMRAAVLDTARAMSAAGLNRGTAGNVSVRCDRGEQRGFIVTPTGLPYDEATAADMVAMQIDGTWNGRRAPSSEWRFHRDIYAARPEAGAILHAHSPFAASLACLRRDIPAFHYMIARFGGTTVRCAPYATFGTQTLSDNALAALEGRCACLLANHGMIVFGRDLHHTLALAIEFETLCEHYWRALQIGQPTILSDGEMAVVLEKFRNYGQLGSATDSQ